MTATEYLASEIYRLREQEMIRNNERRRIALERLENQSPGTESGRGILDSIGARIHRVQALVRHQPVRG